MEQAPGSALVMFARILFAVLNSGRMGMLSEPGRPTSEPAIPKGPLRQASGEYVD